MTRGGMHLSLLSDTQTAHRTPVFHAASSRNRGLGRAHRDGLIRGLAFLAAISLPLGFAIATGHAGQNDPSAGYAQTFDVSR